MCSIQFHEYTHFRGIKTIEAQATGELPGWEIGDGEFVRSSWGVLIGVILGGFTSATTGVDVPKFRRLFSGLNAPAPEKREGVLDAVPDGEGFDS